MTWRSGLERVVDYGSLTAMTLHEPLTSPQVARLTVEDFDLLNRSGAFDAYAKTELINGTIFVVNAQYSEHMKAKVRLLRRLADACDALGTGLEAWSEGSVDMRPASMPEPDVFVTRQTPESGAIRSDSLALIVEVSDTTAGFDLGEKAALYAANAIPEYWVIDLQKKNVHQLWAPTGNTFAQQHSIPLGEQVAAVTIPGLAVETQGL